MKLEAVCKNSIAFLLTIILLPDLVSGNQLDKTTSMFTAGNFGLPGIIDLPTAKRFPDGEIVVTQQLHKSLARSGISFQALPRLGFSFRYSGHGYGGREAHGRINHDRSFDAHLSILDESTYRPSISIGLRDFIGTGWYTSEYIVGTKSLGRWEVTAGLGYGRLAGRNSFDNPFRYLLPEFKSRTSGSYGLGGTLGKINWFTGNSSAFFGIKYQLGNKIVLSSEYTPDLMLREKTYLKTSSPWNYGVSYQINDHFNISANYLYGNQASLTATIAVNPDRPPRPGGLDLAPIPMRLRGESIAPTITNEPFIRRVLAADNFKIHSFKESNDAVSLEITNTKFRSTAQALGRVSSTLQRFTPDRVKSANVSFYDGNLHVASYVIDLENIGKGQFSSDQTSASKFFIKEIDQKRPSLKTNNRISWGIGPYVTHRLFNPDLPLSMETGIEIVSSYQLMPELKFSGAIRKSVLTNLTDNKRRSNSVLPRVHSDWPLYDFAGQKGHIHELTLTYNKQLSPSLYGKLSAGLLEPFFAGIGVEILYKRANSPFAFGVDIHRVRKRDYNMVFDLLDYETTLGHLSFYYDAGGMFDLEINAGRYLAGDWGATTTISRKFGSGWEVGGYVTLTDVPFMTFGEGSFDKAIYVSVPIDWITSSPNRAKRRLNLRPITRDGGANLASARSLNRQFEKFQNASIKREFGRLWK